MSKKQTSRNSVYFENLNAIRFIAAFLVIVHHTEQFKRILNLPNHWNNKVIVIIGELGVVLFFVLSGFLITYLLFKEQDVKGEIKIKDFYIRRILRIWPLYFLIIFSAFFILPFIPFFTLEGFEKEVVWQDIFFKLSLYVLFLPNLALNIFGIIPYASQLWSIGAEEQFYLIWPVLNKKIRNKWMLVLSVICIYLLVQLLINLMPESNFQYVLKSFWDSTPIDCMAIGGIFALIIHKETPPVMQLRKILFSRTCQWSILFLVIILILNGIHFPYLHYELYALLFGILICSFAYNKNRIFSMEHAITNYLGKISYSIYMLHPIAIITSIKLLGKYGIVSNYLLYPVILIIVISIAALSYTLFEKWFIRKKLKFSHLTSGDDAKKLMPVSVNTLLPTDIPVKAKF